LYNFDYGFRRIYHAKSQITTARGGGLIMLPLEGVNGFTQIPFTALPQPLPEAVDFAAH